MQTIGLGYDSHRFGGDGVLKLGGVEIPHHCGLLGHSDADAVLHAITDAILGAAGHDDIGELFPDTDPQYRNADSTAFLQRALSIASEQGLGVVNCDVTILAQAPRLGDHKRGMKARLAELLALPTGRVAVKAKTNEFMGLVGQGEGIAVIAAVLLSDTPPV
ncbi:MAG: 2-C-methyl-D-erythritol 2,4-cyclodiphosphate synthase [Phycisphaerae bacterium]|jgi:2-C-methyl-D-erythritol 2,4-cyclodiphosphate synthase|nr:2-C-methyl-D-erythritol 2,4-cyclodiphosphate synthase [Phycisphaerae bacterium]